MATQILSRAGEGLGRTTESEESYLCVRFGSVSFALEGPGRPFASEGPLRHCRRSTYQVTSLGSVETVGERPIVSPPPFHPDPSWDGGTERDRRRPGWVLAARQVVVRGKQTVEERHLQGLVVVELPEDEVGQLLQPDLPSSVPGPR